MTNRFEKGKIYLVKSRCDRVYFEVTARTAKTATFKLIGRQEDANRFDPYKIEVAGNGETQKSAIRVEDNVEYGYVKVEVKNWNVVSEERVCIEAKDEVKIRVKAPEAATETEQVAETESASIAAIETAITINVSADKCDDLDEEALEEIKTELAEITEGKNFRCNVETGICVTVKTSLQVVSIEKLFDSYDLSYQHHVFTVNKTETETELASVETCMTVDEKIAAYVQQSQINSLNFVLNFCTEKSAEFAKWLDMAVAENDSHNANEYSQFISTYEAKIASIKAALAGKTPQPQFNLPSTEIRLAHQDSLKARRRGFIMNPDRLKVIFADGTYKFQRFHNPARVFVTIAKYNTADEVNQVIDMLTAAVNHGNKSFKFPTFTVDNGLTQADIAEIQRDLAEPITAPTDKAEPTIREKTLAIKDELHCGYGRYLGDGRYARQWKKKINNRWENVSKKVAAAFVDCHGLTLDEFYTEREKWVDEEVARGAAQMAAEDQARNIKDKIARESKPLDTDDVFDLLPTLDELNDFTETDPWLIDDDAEYTERDARFNRGERHAAKLQKELREVDPTVEVTYGIDDEDDRDFFHMRFDGIFGGRYGTVAAVKETFYRLKADIAEAKAELAKANTTPKTHAAAVTADLNGFYTPLYDNPELRITPIADGKQLHPAAKWFVGYDDFSKRYGIWSEYGWHVSGFSAGRDFCGWIEPDKLDDTIRRLKAAITRGDKTFSFENPLAVDGENICEVPFEDENHGDCRKFRVIDETAIFNPNARNYLAKWTVTSDKYGARVHFYEDGEKIHEISDGGQFRYISTDGFWKAMCKRGACIVGDPKPDNPEPSDREKFAEAQKEVFCRTGKHLGGEKFEQVWSYKDVFARWVITTAEHANKLLAAYGLTVDTYLAAREQDFKERHAACVAKWEAEKKLSAEHTNFTFDTGRFGQDSYTAENKAVKIGEDTIEYDTAGKIEWVVSDKYGALLQFLPNGEIAYFTKPLRDDGKSFYNELDRWDADDFFLTLAERGACTIGNPKPADDFAAKLAKLESKEARARAAVEKAKVALLAAQDVRDEAEVEYRNVRKEISRLLNTTASKLTEKIWELPLNAITLNNQDGKSFKAQQGGTVTPHIEHTFKISNGWKVCGYYDTPAQVTCVIEMLAAAVNSGKTEFTFPTIDELSKLELTADSLKEVTA